MTAWSPEQRSVEKKKKWPVHWSIYTPLYKVNIDKLLNYKVTWQEGDYVFVHSRRISLCALYTQNTAHEYWLNLYFASCLIVLKSLEFF